MIKKIFALLFLGIFLFAVIAFAEQLKGYKGEVGPGMKLWKWPSGEMYLVPENFPGHFLDWQPSILGAKDIFGDYGLIFFEALSPDVTETVIVCTYASDVGRPLAIQYTRMTPREKPEKWVTLCYIDEGLFKTGEISFKLIQVKDLPDVRVFIEMMKIKLDSKKLILS